ncbi:DNA cytosine methyltransferase [Deinococcus radiotolerans]|uniref:DNA (cytosine-5-)-methyltransferase n=1 Tax=Deinococcus radiotolerans TaxID=1309407 RepID=A0ABQ2FF20_9DEIO|nr:DNA cytosine methyltransferase [Deinococcus radiotolerans]GGK91553.1 DNA methyltransferase [Deinococcus radiotolerans]
MKHDTGYAPLFPYLGLAAGAVVAEGELIVDNFAGGGGASTGLEQALGRPVDIAVNHDPEAVAMHEVNHPHTQHFCESVWEVDPRQVTAGRPVALAWFSPDCKHFSKAKGGKPVSKEIRGLAWVALRWAATVRPRVIVVENVEEFRTWGPLGENGRPCPKQQGRTFRSWVNALQRHGYQVQWRELVAYEFGAPTSRKRLFIVARRDGQPIVWPIPTHGKPTDPRVQSGELEVWKTAADCIDWDIPAPSIFGRKKVLVPATHHRIAQGILRFTLRAARPFVVTCNHQGDSFRGQGADEPMRTLTAAHDAHGAVVAQMAPQTYQNAPRAANAPLGTATTQSNAQTLVTAALAPRYGERPGQAPRTQPVTAPLPTVVTSENGSRLTVASLTKIRTGSVGTPATEPLHTVTAGGEPARPSTGNVHALTSATVVKIDNQRSRSLGAYPVDVPGTTEVTKASKAVATVQLVRQNGGHCAPETAPYPADVPVKTVTSQGKPHDVLTAQLVQYNRNSPPKSAGRPINTQSTRERFGLATAQVVRQFGTSVGHAASEPARTITTQGGGKSLLLTAECGTGLTTEQQAGARKVYAFLREHLGAQLDPHADHDRGLVLVHLNGEAYVITDIGMRMLEPRELYRAQGFPETYQIEFMTRNKKGKAVPLSKRAQVRMCGNAVPPPFSRAIAYANLAIHMQEAAD